MQKHSIFGKLPEASASDSNGKFSLLAATVVSITEYFRPMVHRKKMVEIVSEPIFVVKRQTITHFDVSFIKKC